MIQNQNLHKPKRTKYFIFFTSVLLMAVLAALALIVANRNHTEAVTSSNTAATSKDSKFSFDTTKATGWRQGPTNNTSLALFSDDHSCFASVEYRSGNIDAATELQKSQASLVKDGYTITASDTVSTSITSSKGQEQYQLHEYNVSGNGNAGQLYGGHEFGYVALSGSHLFVQGYCNTADQLSTTLPALQAIKLNLAK